MNRDYSIKKSICLVRDEKSTRYHVSQDDYFGTIATILSLLEQRLKKNSGSCPPDFLNTLNRLEKDLIWLQANYQIKPRTKKKKTIPKGREISQ